MFCHPLLRTAISEERVLLYAPTLGQAWIVAGDRVPSADFVEAETPLQTSPRHLDLTLVLSHRCNLRCVYCYEGHNEERDLSLSTAQQIALDLVERHPDVSNLIVGYFGGEPTLCTDFMMEFTPWARRTFPQKKLTVTMTTNGVFSLYAEEHLWDCIDRVKVSIDGPQDIQDLHRHLKSGGSSFPSAFAVLQRLYRQRPQSLSIRTTVTHASVEHLPRICEFFCTHFPGVRQQYEPVMDSCFAEHDMATVEMCRFVDAYLAAHRIARQHGTKIGTSFARFSRFHDSVNRFCGVASFKYTVLPDGSIASCNRVDPRTVWESPFFLAAPGEHRTINRPQYQLPRDCRTCFARYNCKGGCYALRHSLGVGQDGTFAFCDEIRRLVVSILTQNGKEVNAHAESAAGIR